MPGPRPDDGLSWTRGDSCAENGDCLGFHLEVNAAAPQPIDTLYFRDRYCSAFADNTTSSASIGLRALCGAVGMLSALNVTTATAQAVGCCKCPAGNTAAYRDEHLGFRFRSENITHSSSDGSLRWNALAPDSLAFTMHRPTDPHHPDQSLYGGNNSFYQGVTPSDVSVMTTGT